MLRHVWIEWGDVEYHQKIMLHRGGTIALFKNNQFYGSLDESKL